MLWFQDRIMKPLGGYMGYSSEWRDLAQTISRVSYVLLTLHTVSFKYCSCISHKYNYDKHKNGFGYGFPSFFIPHTALIPSVLWVKKFVELCWVWKWQKVVPSEACPSTKWFQPLKKWATQIMCVLGGLLHTGQSPELTSPGLKVFDY
jgi:hypothetical protein